MDILPLFACFEPLLPTVSIRRLAVVAQAVLTMTGRITMLGIARWSEKGGSYRTVNRFFATKLPWAKVFAKFFETHIFNADHEYIVAGDETVVGKSGGETFGIDRFFSGLKGKVIRGLSFFVVSLVDVRERKSYPLLVKQTVKSEAEKQASKRRRKSPPRLPKAGTGGGKGRGKGSPQPR